MAALAADDGWDAMFPPAEVAAIELATAMAGPTATPLVDELIGRLRGHFAEGQLAELLAVAGEANFNNRVGNAAERLLRGDVRG